MIKAVVFDMDGVIFDSEKLYRKHWMITGKEYGIPEAEMAELCNLIAGATKDKNAKLMKSRYGEDFDYESFRNATMTRMDAEIARDGLELKPGVRELFSYLKEKGYLIGLATSTWEERAKPNLEAAGILEYFDKIVYGGVVPHGKPAPDIYLKACEELNVLPKEAIGVEDSYNGIRSAHAAGMKAIMIPDLLQPTPEILELTEQKLDSLLDLKNFLENQKER